MRFVEIVIRNCMVSLPHWIEMWYKCFGVLQERKNYEDCRLILKKTYVVLLLAVRIAYIVLQ